MRKILFILLILLVSCDGSKRIQKKLKNDVPVYGHVFDKGTDENLSNAVITIKDVQGTEDDLIFLVDSNGYFTARLTRDKVYFIRVDYLLGDYTTDAGCIFTDSIPEQGRFFSSKAFFSGKGSGNGYELDFYLESIPKSCSGYIEPDEILVSGYDEELILMELELLDFHV